MLGKGSCSLEKNTRGQRVVTMYDVFVSVKQATTLLTSGKK